MENPEEQNLGVFEVSGGLPSTFRVHPKVNLGKLRRQKLQNSFRDKAHEGFTVQTERFSSPRSIKIPHRSEYNQKSQRDKSSGLERIAFGVPLLYTENNKFISAYVSNYVICHFGQ